jgi:hypothetical protein
MLGHGNADPEWHCAPSPENAIAGEGFNYISSHAAFVDRHISPHGAWFLLGMTSAVAMGAGTGATQRVG